MTRVHLIGIGGTGLSAIARVLLERGYEVTGSDRARSVLAQELEAAGVRISVGHHPENVRGADLVVRSSAVADDNVEVQAALAAGIPVLKRAQFLSDLMQGRQVIAVAGTHGKTSTTAMIAWVLVSLGMDPSYIIGGTARNLGSNAHAGKGRIFVIEADEYDRMFLGLNPDIAVITFMEHDHPDCYPTMDDYRAAFAAFVARIQPGGLLLAAYDQPETRALARQVPAHGAAEAYGKELSAGYSAENVTPNQRGGFSYTAVYQMSDGSKVHLADVSLQVAGEHNVLNSLATLAVVHRLVGEDGASAALEKAAAALGEFSGTGRRFEVLGEAAGVTVVDDYAHHPTEIQATLAAAQARYPVAKQPGRRIWAVWQPHTYSRTRMLLSRFAESFRNADRVLVTEVYAAREKAEHFDHFSAAQVVGSMNHPGAQFVPSLEETTAVLLQQLQPGDILLVLSAGDADQVSSQVLSELRARERKET